MAILGDSNSYLVMDIKDVNRYEIGSKAALPN